MISRNQIRHRHKNMMTKTILLLASLPYANNFTALVGVFFYGYFGENIEHLLDSESQYQGYINYRMNRLNTAQQNLGLYNRVNIRDVYRDSMIINQSQIDQYFSYFFIDCYIFVN